MAESIYQESMGVTGLPGVQTSTRLVGTVSGSAPTSGTFSTNDFVVDQTGGFWVCSSGGTPGNWNRVNSNAAVASVNLTAQTAAISPTTLYTTTTSGLFNVSYYAKVTTPAGSSSNLGPFNVISTDPDGNTVTTVGNISSQNSSVSGFISGNATIYVGSGTNIQYSLGYTSSGSPSMAYSLRAIVSSSVIAPSINAVNSFNGRTGAVIPASADYSSYYVATSGGTISGALSINNLTVTGTIASTMPSYPLINDGSNISWYKLGTWSGSMQAGQTLKLVLNHHAGYNSAYGQNQETHIFFKTSNGSSLDSNGFAGDGMFWYYAGIGGGAGTTGVNSPSLVLASGIVVTSNNAGGSANSYTFYAYMQQYLLYSFITATCTSGTYWTNSLTPNQTVPASGSSTTAILSINNSLAQYGVIANTALQGVYEKFVTLPSALSASVPANLTAVSGTLYWANANPTATWTANLTVPNIPNISTTFALTVNNGATAYLPSNITINGTQAGASSSALPASNGVTNNSITTWYQGGTVWSSADASNLDVYTFTVMCTASGVYTLLLGLNKF